MEFQEIFTDLIAWESLIAVAIFAAFLIGAFILQLIIKTTANHIGKKSPNHIVPLIGNIIINCGVPMSLP